MKKFIFPFVFAFCCMSAITAEAATLGGPLMVRLVIDNTTTAEDLDRMADFMKDNGYSLNVQAVSFNEEGHVQSIMGDVDFGKASGTFTAPDMSNAVLIIKKSLLGSVSIEMEEA